MELALPLCGIKVIELATVVAAPAAAKLLSDYGAEVIKIEAPVLGDPLRTVGEIMQLPIDDDNSPLFDLVNSGKKVIAVDLKSAEGKEIAYRLLENADVFISNIRMRSLESLGLDYSTLKQRFPRLIYAHFSGYGPNGPEKDRPGYDATAFWLRTGVVGDMVLPGQFPARPPYAFGDLAASSYFLNGILMALLGRERTGQGTFLCTSLFASGLWMSMPYVLSSQNGSGRQLPLDRYDPNNPFTDIYLCKDSVYISIVAKKYSKDRAMLAELFGMRELVDDPELADISSMRLSGRLAGVTEKLERIIRAKSSVEWAKLFELYDMPYEILRHIRNVVTDEQALANGYLGSVEYPDGKRMVPLPPISYTAYGRRSSLKAGRLGANTAEVLRDLGFNDDDIRSYTQNKLIK